MIRLFISKWNGRWDWLQTSAEHDVIWSIWAGDHGKLSCAYLNGEQQFHANSHELISALLAFPADWAQLSSTAMWRTRSTTAWLPDNCTRPADSLLQTVDASKFPTLVRQFTQVSMHHTALTDSDFLKTRIASSCEIFMILFNFYWYLGLNSFSR